MRQRVFSCPYDTSKGPNVEDRMSKRDIMTPCTKMIIRHSKFDIRYSLTPSSGRTASIIGKCPSKPPSAATVRSPYRPFRQGMSIPPLPRTRTRKCTFQCRPRPVPSFGRDSRSRSSALRRRYNGVLPTLHPTARQRVRPVHHPRAPRTDPESVRRGKRADGHRK